MGALLIIAALAFHFAGKIDSEVMITVIGLGSAGVGLAAKDFDRTGKQ